MTQTSEKPTLVERLRHASDNALDMYMHEVNGRAADKIIELEAIIIKAKLHHDAPCCLCGYNGQNYFQPDIHECMKIEAEVYGD